MDTMPAEQLKIALEQEKRAKSETENRLRRAEQEKRQAEQTLRRVEQERDRAQQNLLIQKRIKDMVANVANVAIVFAILAAFFAIRK